MSKSLGNLVLVRDLLGRYSPDTLRFYLAQHHYRQAWEYDEAEMDQAVHELHKLDRRVKRFGGHGEVL